MSRQTIEAADMPAGAANTFFGADANNILGYYPLRSDLAPYTDPNLASFGWINQGAASVTAHGSGILLRAPATTAANLHIQKYDVAVAGKTITVFFRATFPLQDTYYCGLCFREGSSGKLAVAGLTSASTGLSVGADKWTDEATFAASYASAPLPGAGVYGLRISDTGTLRKTYFTLDGMGWVELHSVGRTDFCTPDQVGWYAGSDVGTLPALDSTLNLISWEEV